jgi:hypothetical protein
MSTQAESQAKVPYVQLGKSGLKVSVPIVCSSSVLVKELFTTDHVAGMYELWQL